MATKIPVCFVEIVRAEGLIHECDKPERFLGPDALLYASLRLGEWARTAPEDGGYDKCDFKIEWADGETYDGRADIERSHHTAGKYDLAEHVRDFLTFAGGLWAPERVTAHYNGKRGPAVRPAECWARYQAFVKSTGNDPAEIATFLDSRLAP